MITEVSISRKLLKSILDSAREAYPKEIILVLRGKQKGQKIEITDLIIPPLATKGRGFASFPGWMLPMDFSLIGSVHSHPSEALNPSTHDLNHAFGKVIMIVGYPFANIGNVGVFNRAGNRTPLLVRTD
ncbi:MAG: Mov34/MPN/PAD-1 family protein [Candidatus Bathyarchaeota archaeon]|nr:MAG: Mov34/MPN/PAD-1 family protein [Candidatus Bathyarchaeota archaeon]